MRLGCRRSGLADHSGFGSKPTRIRGAGGFDSDTTRMSYLDATPTAASDSSFKISTMIKAREKEGNMLIYYCYYYYYYFYHYYYYNIRYYDTYSA